MRNVIRSALIVGGLVFSITASAGSLLTTSAVMPTAIDPMQATIYPVQTENRYLVAFDDGPNVRFSVPTHLLTRLYLHRDAVPLGAAEVGDRARFTNHGKMVVIQNVLNMDGIVEASELVIEDGRVFLR